MNKTIEQAKEQVINYYRSFIDMCLDVHGIDLTTIISDCVTAGFNAHVNELKKPESVEKIDLPQEQSCSKTYHFDIQGRKVSVTADEVLSFYPKHHGLTEADIEEYAAIYVAQVKIYRECDDFLDKALIQRLLDEERLWKNGETDSFKLKLAFTWFVTIRKETIDVFRYTINAFCLDHGMTFDRRYRTLESAILHCLNGFNENVSITDKYQSLNQYLSEKDK